MLPEIPVTSINNINNINNDEDEGKDKNKDLANFATRTLSMGSSTESLAETAAWLQLEYTPRLPLEAVRVWLAALGSAQAVVQASVSTLIELAGERAAFALKTPKAEVYQQRQAYIDAALAWRTALPYQDTRHILTWDNLAYPQQLLTLSDPPLALFVQGNVACLNQLALGMVGARNATPQGLANARLFAQALAEHQLTIISGLALGIDAAAHEGALLATHNPYATVAVIGTGIDRVYPSAHRDLAHRIAAQGAVISEFPMGTPPIAQNFPRRNRLIAALSRGVLVVEAAVRSGSLITARVAAEQGREVLAIPGSIHAPLAKGCHQLIKQGAKLVESAQDVLEELQLIKPALTDPEFDLNTQTNPFKIFKPANLSKPATPSKNLKNLKNLKSPKNTKIKDSKDSKDSMDGVDGVDGVGIVLTNTDAVTAATTTEKQLIKPIIFPATDDVVLKAMGHTPLDLDQIALATGLETGDLLSRLTELELSGNLETVSGGRYQRLVQS